MRAAALLAAAHAAAAAASPRLGRTPPRWRRLRASVPKVLDVRDYGAKGDGHTDDTAAFVAALDACAAGGGEVFAGTGQYVCAGNFTIPPGCTLQGTYSVVPSHDMHSSASLDDGTVLIPTGGRGVVCDLDCHTNFITVSRDAVLAGLVIFYRDQNTSALPVPYPWTVFLGDPFGQGSANNAAVEDVEMLGCWNCISAVRAHRHYIARVQGQPLNIGVFVDETYDIGRIEDVHFNPWFSSDHPFVWWQTTFGRAFVFGRSDWEYVFNTFAFGYAVGYHFIERKTGSMNGNFVGIGMDLATNASVLVEQSQPYGILITNGEFTAFCDSIKKPGFCAPRGQPGLRAGDADPSHVVVQPGNAGAVKFVNSAFWGPAAQVAKVAGKGVVTFSQCHFDSWDHHISDDGGKYVKKGTAAIQQQGGSMIVTQSEFSMAGSPQIELSKECRKTIVTENMVSGKFVVNGTSGGKVVARDNLDDS